MESAESGKRRKLTRPTGSGSPRTGLCPWGEGLGLSCLRSKLFEGQIRLHGGEGKSHSFSALPCGKECGNLSRNPCKNSNFFSCQHQLDSDKQGKPLYINESLRNALFRSRTPSEASAGSSFQDFPTIPDERPVNRMCIGSQKSCYFCWSSPTRNTARKASWGMSTLPMRFMRFLPSFCFSNNLRLRVMSPP